ncbi:unnamed protein product [Phaedon cochleariae]|uniref:Rab-GAP TBC domain-containing protein n=1 Tax=Phaedon cochleariae TaxID=80249 RepID=A0A9N9SHY8_PHACE|nr:unnamed protein product [Phaedon cochleariae]
MEDITEDCSEVFSQDGVLLKQAPASHITFLNIIGTLYVTESPSSNRKRYIEWKPNDITVDSDIQDQEWAVVNTIQKRSRTLSGNYSHDYQSRSKCIKFTFEAIRSFRVANKSRQLTFYDGKGDCLFVFVFQHGNCETLIGTLRRMLKTSASKRDKHMYVVYNADFPEFHQLNKSFAELDIQHNDRTVWSVFKNLKDHPYEVTFEAFAKVTDYVYRSPEHREIDDHDKADLNRSLSEYENTTTHSQGEYEVVAKIPDRKDFPRLRPLTLEQWKGHMNYEGKIEDEESLKNLIFRGGVTPSLRKEVWKFLLDYYPWSSTESERQRLVESRSNEYFKMKVQWKTISKVQEDNFSDYRDRKSLIEKDVNRTDRTLDFYAGDDNTNLHTLNDILMTYIMYNFDLGYVQGMSDLLSPILQLLEDEVDSFWCFVGFMNKMSRNFDIDQAGMKDQLGNLHTLLAFINPQLANYLDTHDSGNMFFCFRWLLVWFKRELSQEDVMRFWEVLWTGYPCENFHLMVCVAILDTEKNNIIQNNYGFTEILKMPFTTILIALTLLPYLDAQLYFPRDDGGFEDFFSSSAQGVPLAQGIPPAQDYPPAQALASPFRPAFEIPLNLTALRGTPQYERYVDQIISMGIAKFTLEINRDLLRQRSSEHDNVVFAPMSIASALALVLLGSNGKTFHEISSVLGLATGLDIEHRSIQVHAELGRIINKLETTSGLLIGTQVTFAAAVFIQNDYPIRSLYKETAEKLYQSEILNVDFASNPTKAQQVVNAWVSDRTNGKIKDILAEAPSSATKVIIASAMYFKASWEKPFFEGSTARRPFFTNGRRSRSEVDVEMMANGGEFPYYKDPNMQCEIMGFPYKGNATVMYVVMPFNSNTQMLKQLENALTAADLERLADSTVYTRAITLLPKMKIESTLDLRSSLVSLGVKSLFDSGSANLALLSPGENSLPSVPTKISGVENNPLSLNTNDGSVLIFSRTGEAVDCSSIFDPASNVSVCQETVPGRNQKVLYKKFGGKVGRRVARGVPDAKETLDDLRQLLNHQSTDNNYQNPGLYADKVLHKVYMDITETGTEAAASTSVSLSRDGSRVTFRVDVPFLFFIRHEETKTILFWGSVNTPTPYFKK